MNRRNIRIVLMPATIILAGLMTALLPTQTAIAADSSITQLASFRISPDKNAEADRLLSELTSAVKAKEPGVLAYIAHRSSADPSLITFFEIYENEAAVKNHGTQPHLEKLREAFTRGVFKPYSSEVLVKIERLDRVSGFSR